jgi:hypothetical protein
MSGAGMILAVQKERYIVDGDKVGSHMVKRGRIIGEMAQIRPILPDEVGQFKLHPKPTAVRKIAGNRVYSRGNERFSQRAVAEKQIMPLRMKLGDMG